MSMYTKDTTLNVVVPENQQAVILDEVKNYLNARCMSIPEAMCRLLENKMHNQSHSIWHLAVSCSCSRTRAIGVFC